MKTRSKKILLLLQMTALLFSTCGLTTEREQNILAQYSDRNRDKYADLLVEEPRYTTTGVEYHRKYYRHLIGIAGDIVDNKKLQVEKASVGFYYDRISGERRKLYLGLDIAASGAFSQPYEAVAVSLIRKDLKEIVQTVNSCRSIFDEAEVVGMVIGWRWTAAGAGERVNVWILESDLLKFEDGMLTFDELVQRSTITSTIGRVIRLPF
ncbi:MAG TPA: hypothetical protein PLA65_02810 [Spirochaetota bacterium]|nr:hypothetical protein [Spirochaetota bacterium]HOD16370.1 hypothetical protein [Spirochaetota bacterium]HPG52615.1 hypothetical protein [Spirochaetota bacterium]HPN10963.1 hypothetical protein [Spirochaetota bacterium]